MIFITGDTHGDFTRFSSKNWEDGKNLTKSDFVIILGDFGGLWLNTPDKNEMYWLNWLADKPWITLFCDGNHENHIRLNKLQQRNMFGDVVGKVSESIFHLKRGRVYTIDDKKFFCMGGAKSIDKIYRKEYISWWPDEEPNWAELNLGLDNLAKHNFEVDYIIAHTCPISVLKKFNEIYKESFDAKLENLNKYFEEVCARTKFKQFFFGHFHKNICVENKFRGLYEQIIQIGEEQ